MLYAEDTNGEKILASKDVSARCPSCKSDVRAKCGSIVTHHWAHVAADCDPWSEPESEWHRGWKSLFPKECCEVVIGPHRADVRINGTVIEFQNSPISPEEIAEREAFYGDMIWVLNGNDFFSRLVFFDGAEIRSISGPFDSEYVNENRPAIIAFDWKQARKCWAFAKKPVFIHFEFNDLGTQSEYLFQIDQFPKDQASPGVPQSERTLRPADAVRGRWRSRYGRGRLWSKEDFVSRQRRGAWKWKCPICRASKLTRDHIALLKNQHFRANYGGPFGRKHLARVFRSIVSQYVCSSVFYHDRNTDDPLSMPVESWSGFIESVILDSMTDDILDELISKKTWYTDSFGTERARRLLEVQTQAVYVAIDLIRLGKISCSTHESKSVSCICDTHRQTELAIIRDDGVVIVPAKGKDAHVSQDAVA